MSSTGTPLPSPFVRGTSDTAHVFFLQADKRRPIPNEATLNFMLAGQTVRVFADADLAAIPLGPGVPSRADGSLLMKRFSIPPPQPLLYLMTGGLRRRVPDIATSRFLTDAGTASAIEAADLDAIPEGPLLPSRADNLFYRGTAGAFAYKMSGGQKRSIPNATTARDAGGNVDALLPISNEDAGLIPNGPPIDSTSRFLNPAPSAVPLVLLPVRIETRFQPGELWLRVYPDDVHINTFEPQLTSDEQSARSAYLQQAAAGKDAAMEAFGTLVRKYGASRAAWIASSNVPAGNKSAEWSAAPFTNLLPERWIVIGYTANRAGEVLAVGPPIADRMQVGPAPTSAGPLSDPGMKWMTDFNTAIAAGMAFRIPLTGGQTRGFNRIVVIGLKSGLSPKDSAARLGDQLQAHHYTGGLALLPINTPTNNTEAVTAGYSSKTKSDAVFAVEQGPPLCPSRATADGDRLAEALSIAPALFAHVSGANGSQDEVAAGMNTVMWPGTWGYYLAHLVTGSVPNPEVLIPAAREHFSTAVRARGHFPILRMGRQPYGVLPVCWSAQWKPVEDRPLDAPLAALLTRLRTAWVNSLPNVPRIPGSADPEASLAAMLGMTATTKTFAARHVFGPEYNFSYWNFVQKDLAKTWWANLAQKAISDTGELSSVMASTRLANSVYVRQQRLLTNVLVAPEPTDRLPAPGYIAQLTAMGWEALRDAGVPSTPVPLFFLLLRYAALQQYMDTALDLLTAKGAAQPVERIEAELLGFSTVVRATAWDLLGRNLPGNGAVGAFLDTAKQDPGQPGFAAFWKALGQLSSFSATDLDAATREVFDLASYRLDAWITSMAYSRLRSLRSANPNGGIVLGAYGWLENVAPQSQAASSGFLHAPSLNQATTAAVLRSGYLSHAGGSERPFEVDLSSARVRLATHLLDGVREGQALGALLGYRLERTMHELGLDQYIDNMRTIAPMHGASNDLDVVDGLVLLEKFNSPEFWNHPGLPGAGTPQRTSLTTAIARLINAVDAVADLTLAESVHQLTRGNVVRAGATLDSIARGDTPPAEIDIVNTPRSGTALAYRLMTVAPSGPAAGWSATPRAQAEPRLNAWAATLLGNPKLVHIRAEFTDAGGTVLSTSEMGLDQLGLAPLDLLSLPEADGVPQELGDRIQLAAWKTHPAGAAAVHVVTARDPAWKPQIVGLPEWLTLVRAVARLVNSARPLLPEDLVIPGDSVGTMNAAEVATRANAAEQRMRAALATLQAATANDTALAGAAAFGVTGAVPDIDPAKWPAQIAFASADLAGRAKQLDTLAAGFTRASATPKQSFEFDSARLRMVFGGAFQSLPLLAPGAGDLWANSTKLQGKDPLEAVRWFQRAARVRPGARRLDSATILAETLSGQLLVDFKVAQLPASAEDRWVALPGSTSTSRLSLVAFAPVAPAANAAIAGLLIDEWNEVLPSTQQMTGVAFQYADPVARPPQTILLGVRPDSFPEWTLESVEGTVLEALELAKIRAVDPDSLGAFGHYLPALYFAYNAGAPKPETVSVDLNTVLKTSL